MTHNTLDPVRDPESFPPEIANFKSDPFEISCDLG